MQKFYWLFLNLGLRKNFGFFVAVVSAEIEVKNCMRSSTSACIALRWKVGAVKRDVTRGSVTLAFAQYIPSLVPRL